jgi:hypothetical protein
MDHEQQERAADEGGEPACMAPLVCPDCGAVTGDAGHRTGCPTAQATPCSTTS